jgi:hypothetical protein
VRTPTATVELSNKIKAVRVCRPTLLPRSALDVSQIAKANACRISIDGGRWSALEVVQTFCTSLKRPEAGRSRRRLGARPSLSWRTRRPRRQPVGWRAKADRAAATTGPEVVSWSWESRPAAGGWGPGRREPTCCARACSARPGLLRGRGYYASGGSAPAPGWLRTPVTLAPGQAEQTPADAHRPGCQLSRPS